MWPFRGRQKYLSALLIVVEDEPPGGGAELAERLLDQRSGRSARRWRRHWTDNGTKRTMLLNERCGSFSQYDVVAFAAVQFRQLWGIDPLSGSGLKWGPFAIGGVQGWVFDLWNKKRLCTSPILECHECQQTWDLTRDAGFVTDEGVEETFVAFGGHAIIHLRDGTMEQPIPRDLVTPVTTNMDAFRIELERVLRDLRRGRPRRWVCKHGHKHGYPGSFFRYDFDARHTD